MEGVVGWGRVVRQVWGRAVWLGVEGGWCG